MNEAAAFVLVVTAGYLVGSFPSGLVFTRLAGMEDIRSVGSGNIGATNVLRTGNRKIAFATLVIDMLKGVFAVLLARTFASDMAAAYAGLAAFLGHVFPVWLRFKGGKGVATFVGVAAGHLVWAAVGFAAIWLAAAFLFRYSSLAALAASLGVPVVFHLFSYPAEMVGVSALMTAIVFLTHRENIQRLWKGREPKIGGNA